MLAELCASAHHLWIDAGVDHGSSNIDRSLGYIVTMLQVQFCTPSDEMTQQLTTSVYGWA
jgi:hypothetical protein